MQRLIPEVSAYESIQSLVMSRPRDFDALFEGFTEMRAIAYVSSAELLLEFLDQRGFNRIELLVGENIATKQLKDDLAEKAPSVTERLASELEAGRLRILTSKRTVHTKLYILGGNGRTRLIVTSANLTHSARRSQINYAWYVEASSDCPIFRQVEHDYEAHCKDASLFMGDLLDLFEKRTDVSREEIISVWLGAEGDDSSVSAEVRGVVQGLASEAFAHPGEEELPVIRVTLPASPAGRKETTKLLGSLGVEGRDGEFAVSPTRVIRYVEETHGVPLMRVAASKEELWLGFRGNIRKLNTPMGSPVDVGQGLENLEAYINTVELGQCPDLKFAKTSMYEALLYIMAAPFANEFMRERRRRHALVNRRGPRFLYIYGPAQNGKTTFLRYSLKLITGQVFDSLPAGLFNRHRIPGVRAAGTCFPLMFDDMTSTTSKTFEGIVKSHWETLWTEEGVFPQLIFTSNNLNLRDWAKSRIQRIDFDVHFVPSTQAQDALARILERPNPTFGWFAQLYLERIRDSDWLQDDELATAREVVMALYAHAGRSLPPFFPDRPLNELYDPDLRAWQDLVNRRKLIIRRGRDTTNVEFADDLENSEVREYRAALPQIVKSRLMGKTLIIENPQHFHPWLEPDGNRRWWKRLGLRR